MKRNIWKSLLSWKNDSKRKPLILKGARQTGKTYILKAFGDSEFSRVHYFNFEKNSKLADIFEESLEVEEILEQLSFVQQASIDPVHDLIIFDEVQEAPRVLTSLKYFCEDLPGSYVACAGSLLGLKLASASFPVGKVQFLNLYPLCFAEFLRAIPDQRVLDYLAGKPQKKQIPQLIHEHCFKLWKHYLIVGGLPEIVDVYRKDHKDLFEAFQNARNKQVELITTYEADIAKHSGKVNAMHIQRLLRNIPAQLAKAQDCSVSRFRFKGVVPGVSRYSALAPAIDWLEYAGLVHKVPIAHKAAYPLSAYQKDNIFKLYLFDVGLLGALSNLPAKEIYQYEYGSYKGYFAENYVLQQLLCEGREKLYAWQEGSSEIEFLLDNESSLLPVEVKAGKQTRSKSLAMYHKKYNPEQSQIYSARSDFVQVSKGTSYLPLYWLRGESGIV